MDRVLAGFIRALRAAGAEASTAEGLDAARALALVGYANRANLKAALGATLAKSEDEKSIHDRVFDQYFAPPALAQHETSADPAHQQPARTGDSVVDALLSLAQTDSSGESGTPAQGSEQLRLAMAQAARAVDVDSIRFASQSAYFARRMLEQLGIAPLEARLLAQLGQESAAAQAEARMLSAARDTLQHHARALIAQRFELFGRPATDAFLAAVAVQRAIGRMSPHDMERMKQVVTRLAKQLAARHAHRRRIMLRGKLDLRRTLRANAGRDGVPVTLAFKHRRREKPRIVVVCDVSGSVAAHVRFLLLFLYALHGTVTDLRTFAFSNRLKDVAAPLEMLPFDDAMELIQREVGNGSTDYGQAWQDLHDRHWQTIDRRTTVLVLGDARSNGANPRLDLFAELAARAKRVVWLCPESASRWGSGDSCLLQYRPFCTHLSHCATAADLERAIDQALEAYD